MNNPHIPLNLVFKKWLPCQGDWLISSTAPPPFPFLNNRSESVMRNWNSRHLVIKNIGIFNMSFQQNIIKILSYNWRQLAAILWFGETTINSRPRTEYYNLFCTTNALEITWTHSMNTKPAGPSSVTTKLDLCCKSVMIHPRNTSPSAFLWSAPCRITKDVHLFRPSCPNTRTWTYSGIID